jgi:hypothetical protein
VGWGDLGKKFFEKKRREGKKRKEEKERKEKK